MKPIKTMRRAWFRRHNRRAARLAAQPKESLPMQDHAQPYRPDPAVILAHAIVAAKAIKTRSHIDTPLEACQALGEIEDEAERLVSLLCQLRPLGKP